MLLLLLGVGVGSLCSIIGFLYPSLQSFKAIETKQKGDDTQWLIYWTVYALFSILEGESHSSQSRTAAENDVENCVLIPVRYETIALERTSTM